MTHPCEELNHNLCNAPLLSYCHIAHDVMSIILIFFCLVVDNVGVLYTAVHRHILPGSVYSRLSVFSKKKHDPMCVHILILCNDFILVMRLIDNM